MEEAPFETIPAWRIARLRLALRDAMQRGVEAICYTCNITLDSIELGGPLPVRLS